MTDMIDISFMQGMLFVFAYLLAFWYVFHKIVRGVKSHKKKIRNLFYVCLALTAVYTISCQFGYCLNLLNQIAMIGITLGFVIVFVIEARRAYKETLGGLR